MVDVGRSAFVRYIRFAPIPERITGLQLPTVPGARAAFGLTTPNPPLVKVRWYFAPPGARPLPFGTIWASTLHNTVEENCLITVGEEPWQKQWSNGRTPQGATGRTFCGKKEDFLRPLVYNPAGPVLEKGPTGLPICCLRPLRAGIGLTGRLPVPGSLAMSATRIPTLRNLALKSIPSPYDNVCTIYEKCVSQGLALTYPSIALNTKLALAWPTRIPRGYSIALGAVPGRESLFALTTPYRLPKGKLALTRGIPRLPFPCLLKLAHPKGVPAGALKLTTKAPSPFPGLVLGKLTPIPGNRAALALYTKIPNDTLPTVGTCDTAIPIVFAIPYVYTFDNSHPAWFVLPFFSATGRVSIWAEWSGGGGGLGVYTGTSCSSQTFQGAFGPPTVNFSFHVTSPEPGHVYITPVTLGSPPCTVKITVFFIND